MYKKMILVCIWIFLFFFSNFDSTSASLVINEVKLYPTDERFIELYNPDAVTVDLSGWYIQRKTQAGTSFSSLVSNTNFENKKINAKEYFLISRSTLAGANIILSNLTLTESNVIQLKNADGEVVDKACWGEVTDCTLPIVANPSEGKSVGRVGNNNFTIINTPTPKQPNQNSSSSGPTQETEGISLNSAYTGSNENSSIVGAIKISDSNIKTQIITLNNGFVGLPVSFKANIIGYDGQPIFYGRYFWNFGDGGSKEIKVNNNENISHTYFYPGEYTVILEYYINDYGEIPDAVDKVTIKIINADIIISKVGDEKDFFVELANNTPNDVDISKWVLRSNEKVFTFPRNTFLSSKKKIIFSPYVTGFAINDKNNLQLLNSDWKVVFDYSTSVTSASLPVVVNRTKPKVAVASFVTDSTLAENVPTEFLNQAQALNQKLEVFSTNLGAQAISSEVIDVDNKKSFYYVILFIILALGGGVVYFIRQSKTSSTLLTGEDFDILEE